MRILILSLVFLLSSCSKLDLAMKWADWAIVKETDSYFDLTKAQNKELKQQIQKDLARVKKENFPIIAKFLRKIADQLKADKLSTEEIQGIQTEFQTVVRAALNQFQSTALDFSMSTSPEQIEYFKKKYNAETEKHAEEIKTEKDQFKLQKKNFEKWTDEWLNGLNSSQQVRLEEDIKAFPFPWQLQVRSRDVSLKNFLKARLSRDTLKIYMDKAEDERDPEYEKALKEYQIHLRIFIGSLFQSLTIEQKKYLIHKLESRAQELDVLAREP